MQRKSLFVSAALMMTLTLPAHAYVIGVAVSGNGSTTTVGSTNADGSINFYVPLNDNRTYGSSGSLTADTCTISSSTNTCTGGRLDMWLRFAPTTIGANMLMLEFTDLDLGGVNDPWHFLESVRVYDSGGTSLAYVDNRSDAQVTGADYDDQTIELNVNVGSGTYYTRLRFYTDFADNTPRGTYVNTLERVRATLTPVSVPEPATLSMLGAGLLLLGFTRRKQWSSDR